VLNGYDLATVFSDILAPVLTRIGDAWYRGEIRITTEHFASTLLRGKLLTLMQAYPSRRGGAHILVGCAPDEQHEIGSLMLSVLLRVEGYRVEFLGPDLPLDDLSDYAASENPDMIILSAIMHDSAVELIKFPSRLDLMKSRTVFGYGGSAFISHPELHTSIRGEYLGDNYREAVATTTRLVKELNASRKNS
jgi:methanogenic corrinoid protein MtbC1